MKKLNKNILIGLGTVTAIAAPVATVVACQNPFTTPHKDELSVSFESAGFWRTLIQDEIGVQIHLKQEKVSLQDVAERLSWEIRQHNSGTHKYGTYVVSFTDSHGSSINNAAGHGFEIKIAYNKTLDGGIFWDRLSDDIEKDLRNDIKNQFTGTEYDKYFTGV